MLRTKNLKFDSGIILKDFFCKHPEGVVVIANDGDACILYCCESGDVKIDTIEGEPVGRGEALAITVEGSCAVHGAVEEVEE